MTYTAAACVSAAASCSALVNAPTKPLLADASSAVLPNGTVVSAFAWNSTTSADCCSLGLLHWEPPSPEEVRRGGFFKPTEPDFAKTVGPPWPARVTWAGDPIFLQSPDNGQYPDQLTFGMYAALPSSPLPRLSR